MSKKLSKILSTIAIVGALSNLGGCVFQASNIPQKYEPLPKDDYATSEQVTVENKDDYATSEPSDKENITTENETQKPEIDIEAFYSVYSTSNQVKNIADALGAKSDGLFRLDPEGQNNVMRFEHNNGKPITVSFYPSVSENTKNITLETLDEIFGLLQEINPNYHYEVVEHNPHNMADLSFDNLSTQANGATSFTNTDIRENGDVFVSRAKIIINEAAHERSYGDKSYIFIKNTILHELMHVLGQADVYVSQIHQIDATTIVNNSLFDHKNVFALTHMTPNDHKNLIANYSMPTENLDNTISKAKDLSKEYTQYYYANWAENNFKNEILPSQGLQDGSYSFSRKVWVDQQNRIQDTMTFNIEIVGDQYKFTATNSNGKIVETSSGLIKFLNIDSNNQTGQTQINNAVAILEGLQSKYIFSDIYRDNEYDSGFLNAIIYKSGDKIVFKDAISTINTASMQHQELENAQQMQ